MALADESLLEEGTAAGVVVLSDVPLLPPASGVRLVDCWECLPCRTLAVD